MRLFEMNKSLRMIHKLREALQDHDSPAGRIKRPTDPLMRPYIFEAKIRLLKHHEKRFQKILKQDLRQYFNEKDNE